MRKIVKNHEFQYSQKEPADMMANFFTKFLANIFDLAVIFKLVYSENKTILMS